jgi:hypothetical protein
MVTDVSTTRRTPWITDCPAHTCTVAYRIPPKLVWYCIVSTVSDALVYTCRLALPCFAYLLVHNHGGREGPVARVGRARDRRLARLGLVGWGWDVLSGRSFCVS